MAAPPVPPSPPPEAQRAAAAALQQFIVEAFTLLGLGIAITALRTYARVKTVGFRQIEADEPLAWVAMLFIAAETAIAYTLGHELRGLGNSNMTPEQRVNIDPDSDEYKNRIGA
jgi:cytochrome b561